MVNQISLELDAELDGDEQYVEGEDNVQTLETEETSEVSSCGPGRV